MAIIWDGTGHTIREKGALGVKTTRLDVSDVKLDSTNDTVKKIEDSIKTNIDIELPDHASFLHVFSFSPLDYVLRVALKGHIPEKNWWAKS